MTVPNDTFHIHDSQKCCDYKVSNAHLEDSNNQAFTL